MESTRTIDIKEFIDEQELDPLFIEKSDHIAPDSGAANKGGRKRVRDSSSVGTQDKAYSLLVKVLHDKKEGAIVKVVLRSEREHLVAIRAYQRGLVLHTLHYLSEIRPLEDIKEISETKVPTIDVKESSLGELLVENLTSKDFDISRYEDEYIEQLEKLDKCKSKRKGTFNKTDYKITETNTRFDSPLKASLVSPSSAKSTKK